MRQLDGCLIDWKRFNANTAIRLTYVSRTLKETLLYVIFTHLNGIRLAFFTEHHHTYTINNDVDTILYQIMDSCVFSAKSLIYDLTWRKSQTLNVLKMT